MNTKIDHVAIKVSDLEENMRFFEEVFGMTVEKSKMFGCTSLPNGENWFRTPTGIIIELK